MRKLKEPLSLGSAAFQKVLLENIIPFWISNTVDEENGGFIGRIDGESRRHPHSDKAVIFNTRMLWSFSAFHRKFDNPKYLWMARRAFEYITTHFLDKEHGGVFWMVDFKGNVKDDKKQIYAQAFAIYSLVEFYKLTQDRSALKHAMEIFKLIEKYSFDKEENGYFEAFDSSWNLLSDLRLSEKDANEAKTMNTHLHILEAYASLYNVWKDKLLEKRLENLITLFLEKFIHPSDHLNLFFDENWQLKSNKFSYGHDIESAWLLYEAVLSLNKKQLLIPGRDAALKLVNAAMEGMDKDGGLMNEGNSEGVEDTDKHWWPQAEALVGLINAWELTHEKKYLYHATKTWNFIQGRLIDHENGEWHWMVNREGIANRLEDKAGPWKCCYHNGRAMLELIGRFSKYKL